MCPWITPFFISLKFVILLVENCGAQIQIIWIVSDHFRIDILRLTGWSHLKFAEGEFGRRIIVINIEPDASVLCAV